MNDLKNTEHIFDSFAQKYQEQFMDLAAYRPALDQFCEFLKSDARVLDIGCGPGNISVYILKKEPKLRIIGIDLSRNMLELAKKNIPSATFRKMDCRNIEKLEENFDAIVLGFCLPYLSKIETIELLNKSSEIVHPEGVLYLSTMVTEKYHSQWVGSSQGGEQRLLTHYHETGYLIEKLENNGFNILHTSLLEDQEKGHTKFRDLVLIAQKIN